MKGQVVLYNSDVYWKLIYKCDYCGFWRGSGAWWQRAWRAGARWSIYIFFARKKGLANKHLFLFFLGSFQFVLNLTSIWNEQQFAMTFIYLINKYQVRLVYRSIQHLKTSKMPRQHNTNLIIQLLLIHQLASAEITPLHTITTDSCESLIF